MGNLNLQFALFLLLCFFPNGLSLWWSSSSPSSSDERDTKIAEFTIQTLSDSKGVQVVEDARNKMMPSNTCWHNAYKSLFESCSEIISNEEKKKRLAWILSDCFQVDSGRPRFPNCKVDSLMVQCLKRLDDGEHTIFLAFFMETNSICHQLQSESFKQETERLVNALAKSAHFAEDKLDMINENSNKLLQDSNQIHDALSSIHEETQQVSQASKNVETHIQDVLESSRAIFHQSKDIARTQLELKEAQTEMGDVVKTNMNLLQESYDNLGHGMDNLMKETIEIERGVKLVGDAMVSKMQDLQSTTDNIESVAGSSLEKQRELLDVQNAALEGLNSLTKFQTEALKESRGALEKISEYGHKQHEEQLQRQAQILKTHDHLHQISQAILEAQKVFESKQSDIFNMLEKLFSLYKAILDESQFIKSFFFYSCVIILLYMLTSAKQTFRIRAHLYLGLLITLLIEMVIIKFGASEVVIKRIWPTRSIFLIATSIQILYSFFTHRDYEILSHQLLQTLVDKVCMLEKNSENKPLPMEMDCDDDDSWIDYSWIDEELPEDIATKEDPDYYYPEETAENFSSTSAVSKNYDLRPRNRRH